VQASSPIGFLTVAQENGGYVGGLLVTNEWGRPLEFRLTSTVTPSPVHRILYGETLLPFIHADLIGCSLVEKCGTPARILFTDVETMLAIRPHTPCPVFLLRPGATADAGEMILRSCVLRPHAEHASDIKTAQAELRRLDANLDLREPFERIREALAETRKAGAMNRAA
jgi:hypothetical protein